MQIDRSNIKTALELLNAGFPRRPTCFWEKGLSKLAKSPAHANGDEPLGYLLPASGEFIGVGLTAVSYRAAGNRAAKRVVNLSSWFVRKEHRWKLPLLLRRMMHDDQAMYTDLTPTRGVEKILGKLGFEPLNSGICAAFAPLAAARRSLPVLPWRRSHLDHAQTDAGQLIEDHIALGCEALSIESSERHVPLLLKPTRIMGLPGMTVIYCPDHAALHAGLGAVCRAIAARGKLALLFDRPTNGPRLLPFGTIVLPHKPRRYARNNDPASGIDHTYSELVYFDI